MVIKTSFFHQGYTLLGRASVTFTIILIVFYSTSFWFTYDAAYLGIPAILLSLLITHYLLRGSQTKLACKILAPILKGKPLVIYTDWLIVEEDNAFRSGEYRVLCGVVNDVALTHFGNIVFRSTAISGIPHNAPASYKGMVILKLPFSALDLQEQKSFLSLLREKCPQAKLSANLESLLNKPVLKSTKRIHALTLLVFLSVLLDVGHSTFEYIELLKRYYLSQKAALDKDISLAKSHYDSAQWLKTHYWPYSLIMPKLLKGSTTSASICEARSRALLAMGQKEAALKAQDEAAKLVPKSFKINLRLARLYYQFGQLDKAKQTVESLAEKHKHALLPQLYKAEFLLAKNEKEKACNVMQEFLSFLDSDYFSPPPVWPPAGEETLHELFTRDDLGFLLSTAQKKDESK